MSLIRQQWVEQRRAYTRVHSALQIALLYLEVLILNPGENKHLNRQQKQRTSLRFWFPHVNFNRLNPLDFVRIVLQVLWLIFFQQESDMEPKKRKSPTKTVLTFPLRVIKGTNKKVRAVFNQHIQPRYSGLALKTIMGFGEVTHYAWLNTATFRILLTIAASVLVAFTISLPMDSSSQAVMLLLFWGTALWVRDVNKRGALLLMVVLSVLVSTRYLYWRVTQTINWDVPADTFLSLLLLTAEIYAWTILVLGYVQTIWPLERKVARLPDDISTWPSVDVFIPTYNEPLHVVRPTILAALAMDWPEDKLNVYLLDDGKRDEFSDFAEKIGVPYITRVDNSHAKAGNLNHALKKTSGDYITIFDCDHIPTRSFLQLTMGWFLHDPKLALVQTPHHFFSPDPFEKNLTMFRSKPNEGELFYGLIQDGNDMWNASFFCGSCAVLKRGPLEEVGGIAVETVTEDAHTALKMHRLGYNSAYLNIPQAAGLATESLSAHIGQRIRWARGMAQIFRLDNPLRGKGLNLGQRICYANAMLYFLNGIPRIIFMMAPLAFLLLHSYIVFAPAIMIALYALPHIVHSYLTNSRTQGQYRHSFWAEMYETVLAWYILRPTTVALFFPKLGKFNVTAKGGLNEKTHYDWEVSKPYLILVLLCVIGFSFGIWRLFTGPTDEYLTVALNLIWVTYNLIILGGAVAVAEEAKQVRAAHRIAVNRPVTFITASEHVFSAELVDYSDQGAGLRIPHDCQIERGDIIRVFMFDGGSERSFECSVVSRRGELLGLRFIPANIETDQALLRATFSRADAWVGWRPVDVAERPLSSFQEVIAIGIRGYKRMAMQFAPILLPVFEFFEGGWRFIRSILPTMPVHKEEHNG
ncbi:UDP-forming cellulose synthase catalytic subunit [Aliidiomarina shirensis]|uniref:Cellulose synthase catalytic subunit [UDP-forming] n=1 Tax=Aliidiomarina shirensis TaxID=1048642 RepID=A0A432WQC7_9GAMM|nr:UDP-forming cellulose synthase catalytic subunit [Aliidiomarina shirensis]RUO35993.1 UDP-forming cellulose synthase catalytic subunit [Aliidiomarina shirensis]